jgi:hypothetical protein
MSTRCVSGATGMLRGRTGCGIGEPAAELAAAFEPEPVQAPAATTVSIFSVRSTRRIRFASVRPRSSLDRAVQGLTAR